MQQMLQIRTETHTTLTEKLGQSLL